MAPQHRNATLLWTALVACLVLITALASPVSAQTVGDPKPEPRADPSREVPGLPVQGEIRANSVSAFGDRRDLGAGQSVPFDAVAMAAPPGGTGYWISGGAGQVAAFGTVGLHGSLEGIALVAPIVGMASAPDGGGYWLVASDGGVFAFGTARFFGSMGGLRLNAPIVAMASAPDGGGYWLVASDGGVFAFGTARFFGSMGGLRLNAPIVAMASTANGGGYWLAAADGGVFSFGGAPFYGSEADVQLKQPIVGIAASPEGIGYWMASRDGVVFPEGVADFGGAAEKLDDWTAAPVAAIVDGGDDGYWLLHGPSVPVDITDEGPAVTALQTRLSGLGYWLGAVDGVYGDLTAQAVTAFQKATGLPRTGVYDAPTRLSLAGATRLTPTTAMTDVIEVDKTRQIVLVVRGGQTLYVFNSSTGSGKPYSYGGHSFVADTPNGTFPVYREIDGISIGPLGRLYRPKFIIDGIALHGYPFVPPQPASHGCIRLSNGAMDLLWNDDLAPVGSTVVVYGSDPPV
ncbi:MAG: peptidoglycan-binding protein [Acidimicrobiia bacterium]